MLITARGATEKAMTVRPVSPTDKRNPRRTTPEISPSRCSPRRFALTVPAVDPNAWMKRKRKPPIWRSTFESASSAAPKCSMARKNANHAAKATASWSITQRPKTKRTFCVRASQPQSAGASVPPQIVRRAFGVLRTSRRKNASAATSATVDAIAAPLIPIAGIGPQPKMRT